MYGTGDGEKFIFHIGIFEVTDSECAEKRARGARVSFRVQSCLKGTVVFLYKRSLPLALELYMYVILCWALQNSAGAFILSAFYLVWSNIF